MKKLLLCGLAYLLVLPFGTLRAANPTPVLSFTGGFGAVTSGSTVGWSFTLSGPATITSLGVYDYVGSGYANGLVDAHPVDIWNSNGAVVAAATVPAGTGTTSNAGFRYVSIASVTLPAGTYTIGTFMPSQSDPIIRGATITTVPGVAYNGSRFIQADPIAYPPGDQYGSADSYFGPNFQATVVVPEPSAWMLVSLGATGAGLVALRRRGRA